MMAKRSISLDHCLFTHSVAIDTTYGEHNYIKKINQYKLLTEIGKGSYSKVFLALNTETSELYAAKRIRIRQLAKTAIGVSLLQREIGMMNKLHHKNIVGLHEVIFVKENQSVYLIMDYADCGNLTKHKFNSNEIRYIFSQIVEGVSYLHKNGVVHQDIKPQNILMRHDGTPLITDFGIGHSFESCARVVGTPAYQAPEVIDRSPNDQDYDPGKEDIWSLGVTLYVLSFEKLPYQGESVFEIVRSIITTELTPPKTCDPLLWDMIMHMLKPDIHDRYNIDQVRKHPYVTGAQAVRIQLKPPITPNDNPLLPVREISGEVCGEGYVFAVGTRKLKQPRSESIIPKFSSFG